ncbi:MFS transporter [Kitasatospora sp. NBC_01287]|uniref:MFS transporter n=1 Tax=Kitasatospora sp. NBC_01287 TaxID=2903573 RepID=UPI002258834C|nr:MFS transporter [Kitasatospora sp. NBC_01287]MCX4745324.1 MFS transporter [Kitasatospora sp. NBC_01287]
MTTPRTGPTAADSAATAATAGAIAAEPGTGSARLSRSLVLLLATACGLIVADNYYAQPLLPALAGSLRVSGTVAGLCVTVNQLGYALGLVLLVPLGDLLPRRRLVVAMLCVDAMALAGAALAPGAGTLLAMLAVVGLTGSAVNILIPLAATLARPEQRGRAVGTLMTGLLLGILLARTVSGALDQVAGWRAVYGCAAAAIALLALALRFGLPEPAPAQGRRFGRLLASVGTLVRTEPFLRRRMAGAALGFGCFQLLWTAMPFLLTDQPYHYTAATIGLFGLLGAAGAAGAQPIGRLHDRGAAHAATGLLLLTVGLGWALLAGGRQLLPLIGGILLLDLGVQGINVLNQARIYAYPAAVRSRVTTAYMTAYFLGGAAGASVATPLYDRAGWAGIWSAGLLLTAIAAALWLTDRRAAPPTEPTD